MAKPFGHVFKVTPKGANAKKSDYDRTIFWAAAGLMTLTILGLVINARSEWRIIGEAGLLPIVACWAAINIRTTSKWPWLDASINEDVPVEVL